MARFPRASGPMRVLATMVAGLGIATAAEAKNPAQEALAEIRGETKPVPTIQNRFFTKENRFEIAPFAGYVPNNSFAEVPVGGLNLAYHFSETLAAEGMFLYGPNTGNGGVKGLTKTLLDISYQGDQNTTFQQPLDRFTLGAVFGARWSPVYGKINLVGEGVLNFDWYLVTGPGLVLITKDVATVSQEYKDCGGCDPDIAVATNPTAGTDPYFTWDLGLGFNFFLSQTIALKLDARGLFYYGPEADYGNIDPTTGQAKELASELHSVFVTGLGVSIFVPKMKNRAFNF